MAPVQWSRIRYYIAAIATAFAIAMASAPANAGAWVTDAKSGCQVWNPNPQLEETVAWFGSCANGRAEGHGTAQWVKGGATSETDEGEWREGRQTGKGTQPGQPDNMKANWRTASPMVAAC